MTYKAFIFATVNQKWNTFGTFSNAAVRRIGILNSDIARIVRRLSFNRNAESRSDAEFGPERYRKKSPAFFRIVRLPPG